MGGCASRPKEADTHPDSLPSETPNSPKAEGETVAQENNNRGKTQNEAPLVDLSEPKQEGADSSAETKTADAEPASVEGQTELTEAKVESAATEPEVKVEAAKETIEPAKDDVNVVETPKAETPKEDAAPSSKDKSDAPLVTV